MDKNLLNSLRTPCYVYRKSLLEETLRAIADATADDKQFHVHYAIKANANASILSIIRSNGLGADCVSGGEVKAAIEAGFPPQQIVLAGVGKSDEEIELALNAGIVCFNVESLPELEVINEIAERLGKTANVAFRVNPNIDAHTHEKITTGLHENKFGIAPEQLVGAIQTAQRLPKINYVGMHFHIGSQICQFAPYSALCHFINDLQLQLEANGIFTSSINVGGGLGVDYQHPEENPIPDFHTYFRTFREQLDLRPHQQLHFELGRSVVAQCGSLLTRVLYVKEGLAKSFVIVDAGMTDLIRPAMYGAYHQIQMFASQSSEPQELRTYDVVGPVCESSDVFGTNVLLPTVKRGDFITIATAGAYGETMASRYNLRELPHSYIIE